MNDLVRLVRGYWVVIVAGALLGAAGAAAATATMPTVYTATSQVFVSTRGGQSVGEVAQAGTFAESRVRSYAAIVTTPIVLDPVIDRLGLDMGADDLASRVSATTSIDTVLVSIAVTLEDPERAAEVVNAVVDSLQETVAEIEGGGPGESFSVQLTPTQRAAAPDTPSGPPWLVNLALGTIVGAAMGAGSALLLSWRQRPPSMTRGR